MLVVNNGYRSHEIIEYVGELVSSLDEKDWLALAGKLAHVMEWEFEDYA
ncbi:hypothetical protein BST28156_01573 [Burkholderia stagnalis]|nr:hypothetical protein BST28156_01573 [Burkholderia stagnalis]